MIYCILICPSLYSAARASDVGACSTVLYVITEQWSGAKKYRDAFEVVAEKMMESARKFQESASLGNAKFLEEQRLGSTEHSSRGTSSNLSLPNEIPAGGSSYRQTSPSTPGHLSLSHGARPAKSQPISQPSASSPGFPVLEPDGTLGQGLFSLSTGIEINLEYDLFDIGGLLSVEGLDWFTGAVL